MVTMLSAALVGDLLLLPAILAGPFGRFFYRRSSTTESTPSAPAATPNPVDESTANGAPIEPVEAPPTGRVDGKTLNFPENAQLHARLRSLRRESTSPQD